MAGETILVVDDGRENREFIAEYILEPNGYAYLTAKDGKEALEIAFSRRPELILLDYQMPRMNGVEMLRAMQEHNINIPVILMTFYGSEEIAVEVYRLGVRDYVKKPFSIEEMLMVIERSLSDVRLRKEKDALTERLIQSNRELQLRLQELNVLYSVGKSVTSLTDIDQVLPRIVDAAVKVTNAEEGFLYLLAKDTLTCRAQKRHNQARAVPADAPVNDPLAMHAISQRQAIIITPEQTQGRGPISVACAPLILRNEVIGALGVANLSSSSHVFTKHDSALLSALTDYAAIAIDNKRNLEMVRQTNEHEKSKIRTTFGRFVSPTVVDQVLDNPEELQLGGKRQEVTVMFADLRGYTSYAENLPPEKVVEMLNDYLSLAANVILTYGGTLDKYMGDGLMGLFNAPHAQDDHVLHAVEAAVMLHQASQQLSEQRGEELAFSIGISVGEAVVGYIGTDQAMNYTAIGDVVNLTKRLQEAAKAGQTLVDDLVIQRIGSAAQANALGELKLKGRRQTVLVHEVSAITAH